MSEYCENFSGIRGSILENRISQKNIDANVGNLDIDEWQKIKNSTKQGRRTTFRVKS